MALWTPQETEDAHRLDAEREALLNRAVSDSPVATATTRQLREVDPYLECVWVDQRAEKVDPSLRPPGLIPGRWHVRRSDPRFMDAYFPIMGPKGEYVEPGSKLIDDMKKADLWRRGALQELRERQERSQKAQEAKDALAAEQRRDAMATAWRAAKRVAGDGGMAARKWGRGH